MTPTGDVEELARQIAARMAPDALLDAADVGALLGCTARQVLERYAPVPGFPQALRLTSVGGRRGHPRWRRSAIMEWVETHEKKTNARGSPKRIN